MKKFLDKWFDFSPAAIRQSCEGIILTVLVISFITAMVHLIKSL